MRHEEIEVKFLIEDLVAMRQRLVALGATLSTPRTYEENLLFDTPDAQFRRQGRLLRLRRDQRNRLTYKEPPAQHNADFKIMQEYEIAVSDFGQAHAMLTKLGFAVALRFEKYRETFTYQGAEVVLDEVPFGVFMEIEGPQEAIRAIVTALGLDFNARLVSSYVDIFDAVCATYKLPVTDITFEAFRSCTIDLRACQLR
jgi:adenylate cyclase, class 2